MPIDEYEQRRKNFISELCRVASVSKPDDGIIEDDIASNSTVVKVNGEVVMSMPLPEGVYLRQQRKQTEETIVIEVRKNPQDRNPLYITAILEDRSGRDVVLDVDGHVIADVSRS